VPGGNELPARMARLRGWWRRNWLPLMFLLCALPTGMGVILLTPIGEVPDEPQHISRADGLLSGQILGTTKPGSATAGVTMNAALFVVTITEIPSMNHPLPDSARHLAEAVRWNDERYGADKIFCTTQMVRYFPVFYTPGALGILAGQTLRISPLYSLFLGRAFMLLSYLGMGATALRLARSGRPLLFTVLTLPMCLYLAGSFNQDGPMIGAAVLAAALLTRPRRGPSWEWFLALLLLTLIACAKAPYGWLLFAGLLPWSSGDFRRRLAWVAVAVAMPALWLWVARGAGDWPWPRTAYHPGPLWPGDPTIWLTTTSVRDNIEVLLAHPAQIVLLPLRSLISQEPAIWHQMIGSIGWSIGMPLIGWLGPPLPAVQYAGWVLASAVSLLAVMVKEPAGVQGWMRSAYILMLLSTVISVALSAYVTFTSVGNTSIDGMQGRYLLPVIPFLLFVMPLAQSWRKLPVIKSLAAVPTAIFCLPAITMAVLDIYALPAQIFHVFQMPGP
jgi:uncharacterized membrane protein